jgi:hypothetical protein
MKQLALFALITLTTWSQCAMCFRNAESQTRARAEAMNKGIAILFLPLLASTGAIAWLAYKRRARTIVTAGCNVCPDDADI